MQKLYHTLFKQIYCLIFLKQIKLPFPFSSSNSMNERHIGAKRENVNYVLSLMDAFFLLNLFTLCKTW